MKDEGNQARAGEGLRVMDGVWDRTPRGHCSRCSSVGGTEGNNNLRSKERETSRLEAMHACIHT